MKVNCVLRTWYRENNKQGWYEITDWSSKNREDLKVQKNVEILRKLQIVSLSDEDNHIVHILVEKEIIDDGKTYHIHFHSIGYAYDSSRNHIYCLTLIHNI